MTNIYSRKKFRNHNADTIKSKKKAKEILTDHKKSISFSPLHVPIKYWGQIFFSLTKAVSEMMITNNNNSNVISTIDRGGSQWQRYMANLTAPQQTFFKMDLNSGKPIHWKSRKIHPLIKRLFLLQSIPDVPLSGSLKHFVRVCMRITRYTKISDTAKGY